MKVISGTAGRPPLSPGEVAELFRVNPATVAKWTREGKLSCFRTPGGHRRYRADDVEALLNARPPAGEDR